MSAPRRTTSRYYRDSRPRLTALSVQIPYPVHVDDIQGSWRLVSGAEAPAISWGRGDRYWAWLHDLDRDALRYVLTAFARAVADRRGPWVTAR